MATVHGAWCFPDTTCCRMTFATPCTAEWSLDLRPDSPDAGKLSKGAPSDSPDITLTMTDQVFAQLVAGKLNPQNVSQALACTC